MHRRAETGEQSANAVDCVLLLSPLLLPFTACVRSLFMVLWWEGEWAEVEQIQRKLRVRERTPQNAPRIRAGLEEKKEEG